MKNERVKKAKKTNAEIDKQLNEVIMTVYPDWRKILLDLSQKKK